MFSVLETVFGAWATTSTTAARFSMTLSATKHHKRPCHFAVGDRT